MRFAAYAAPAGPGLALEAGGGFLGLEAAAAMAPNGLLGLVGSGPEALTAAADAIRRDGAPIDPRTARWELPLRPPRIFCVGLNYADHAAEAGLPIPRAPTIFARYASSLVASGEPIRRPAASSQLDFEGELAVLIGRPGKAIARNEALAHVAGYSIFNDASLRDWQLQSSQWTLGKTADATGGFGPVFVTADELPPGAAGLAIETRLNGETMQRSNTRELIFDVATLIAHISQVIRLEAGDLLRTGTPGGVGMARKAPRWMAHGDVCEVEIEGVGRLANPITWETAS
jgi:acylpyruvate hydrolase